MTEEELIQKYADHTVLCANQAIENGLNPGHVANVLLLASVRLGIDLHGVEATRKGLIFAATQIEKDKETIQ